MDSKQVNDWAQIVGIFSLVASLIFVGVQLKQNHEIAMAATYQERANASQEVSLMAAAIPGFTSAMAKMYREETDSLSLEEYIALEYHFNAQMTNYENIHFQYVTGFLPEEHWRRTRQSMFCNLAHPIYQDTLQYYYFRDSFQAVVDELLDEVNAEPNSCWDWHLTTISR